MDFPPVLIAPRQCTGVVPSLFRMIEVHFLSLLYASQFIRL